FAPKALDFRSDPDVVRRLTIDRDVAERPECGVARGRGSVAGALELALLHREVELHFLTQLGVPPATGDDVNDASDEFHIGASLCELEDILDRQHDALELLPLGGELLL